ncbi:hypothetical protein PIB30_080765 [Stylosanthes scabra]|uniref:Uncharacterized protein n=1 Tax=Stylosanthes scabra TaxID=79078 RepID=A0ABU6YQD2_9FABA|nr:hypothetical protein [Stylosanthes scabra]
MENIKAVLRLDEQLESDTNFRRRMIPANQDLENVIQDLCVAVTCVHSREVGTNLSSTTYCQLPITVKRAVLIHCIIHGQDVRVEKLIAEEMTEIVINLHTTRHPLEFPNVFARLCKAVEVSYRAPNSNEAVPKIRPITAVVMENIRYPHHQPPPPPTQPQQYVGEGGHQEQPTYDAQMPQGYGWGQLQADMANLRITQTEFYESILAQNASYGLRL